MAEAAIDRAQASKVQCRYAEVGWRWHAGFACQARGILACREPRSELLKFCAQGERSSTSFHQTNSVAELLLCRYRGRDSVCQQELGRLLEPISLWVISPKQRYALLDIIFEP